MIYGTDTVVDSVRIQELSTSAYKIPTASPESDGTLSWDSTTLVLVKIKAGGKEGIGYTYADESTALFIQKNGKEIITGKNAFDIPGIYSLLTKQVRNNGNCGIAMMAISAIDTALWDLKSKLLELPLCILLGKVKNEMLLYGSGVFTNYTDRQLEQQLLAWKEHDIRYMKMKIGSDPDRDIERIRIAKEVIGREHDLFVDANGAYTVKQALDKALHFAKYGVSWFEEPVASDNLKGLQFIREHAPESVNIAAGEYGYNLSYFNAMLNAGAVDILQADATRCGGITGFLKAGHLAEAYQVPFSSHCAPLLHLHASLSLPSFYIAEFFYDHTRIEALLFEETAVLQNGCLYPDLQRPGMGWEFKYADAEKYKL